MTADAKDKAKFRATKRWKEFRKFADNFYRYQDPITLKKLYKGHNLHHMDLNAANYTNTDNVLNFLPLNKTTHEMLHWLYSYYKTDPAILDRIKYYLDMMVKINK